MMNVRFLPIIEKFMDGSIKKIHFFALKKREEES